MQGFFLLKRNKPKRLGARFIYLQPPTNYSKQYVLVTLNHRLTRPQWHDWQAAERGVIKQISVMWAPQAKFNLWFMKGEGRGKRQKCHRQIWHICVNWPFNFQLPDRIAQKGSWPLVASPGVTCISCLPLHSPPQMSVITPHVNLLYLPLAGRGAFGMLHRIQSIHIITDKRYWSMCLSVI